MEYIETFLQHDLLQLGSYQIKIYTIVVFILVFLVTKFIVWLIKKWMFRKRRMEGFDQGTAYAIFQIIKYLIWIIAITIALDSVEIKVTVLIAGSAALLVGVGMGLQQTFNDFVSGIILLSERSIKVGDILEIDGDIVRIEQIGLRTSKGLNRDQISIIIPNSLITTNKVINWSHQAKKTRFKVNVGVAYGSDVDLVLKVLEESVLEHPGIGNKNLIEARFVEFNNSSLDFQVLFFSENVFRIEKIKSEIRKIINQKFIENEIKIPFPQMDIYIKENKQ
ncbi:MAG: mechanosensitive ion channel [Prolixibacteraceae bacterium]|nr:mechanosensitive ion channel [Prolixibacteraceae bacterium]